MLTLFGKLLDKQAFVFWPSSFMVDKKMQIFWSYLESELTTFIALCADIFEWALEALETLLRIYATSTSITLKAYFPA